MIEIVHAPYVGNERQANPRNAEKGHVSADTHVWLEMIAGKIGHAAKVPGIVQTIDDGIECTRHHDVGIGAT